MITPPDIPWQVTGNHWISLPCVHPSDGAIHAVGLISQSLRGTVEFAGGEGFVEGSAPPLLRLALTVDGESAELGSGRMAWQRVSEWLPTFNSTLGQLIVRGTVFAPHGRGADFPGFVYAVSLENRGPEPMTVSLSAEGTLGLRQHRIRSARRFADANVCDVEGDIVYLSGAGAQSPFALAIAGDEMVASASAPSATDAETGAETIAATTKATNAATWSLTREVTLPAGGRVEFAIYVAAGPERDGAAAMVSRMRQRGWRALAEQTREALAGLQQTTGVAAVDRLLNRNLIFAYFYCAARALDDARWYLVRSRAPWNGHAVTIQDWDALMWIIPAIQLADPDLARELLLRTCELHGYAPGRGVNYLDGAPFELAFSSASVAAYAVAVDRYIAQTGDDRIVEDPPIAEALYASHDDIVSRRHAALPLYSTECTPSGATAPLPYTLHANSIIADALDILKHTLDEKSAEKVESGDVVRAAVLRNFATDGDSARSALWTASDLSGASSLVDDPVGSVFWIPLYHMLARDNSTYRRTVRRVETPGGDASPAELSDASAPDVVASGAEILLSVQCARLVGPDASSVLEWLRRADLDNGFAAELLNEQSIAIGNGGDAALSALVAYSVWYAVNVSGVGLA
ncbi:MAG: hypothetical protein ACR2MQ_13405 [Gemmatimonadaceae bacterium]